MIYGKGSTRSGSGSRIFARSFAWPLRIKVLQYLNDILMRFDISNSYVLLCSRLPPQRSGRSSPSSFSYLLPFSLYLWHRAGSDACIRRKECIVQVPYISDNNHFYKKFRIIAVLPMRVEFRWPMWIVTGLHPNAV